MFAPLSPQVLAHRILPTTGVDLSFAVDEAEATTRVAGYTLAVPLVAVLLYALAALFAARADVRGALYTVQPPWWLSPGWSGWTPARQVLVTARVYHSLLRWRYCMPGHTGYSHLMLTHSLLTYVLLTATLPTPTSRPTPRLHASRTL